MLRRTLLSIFALVLIAQGAIAGGGQERGGGNRFAQDFKGAGLEAVSDIERISSGGLAHLLPTELRQISIPRMRTLIEGANVVSTSRTLRLCGQPVDAINTPRQNKIRVYDGAWVALAENIRGQKAFALHEFLALYFYNPQDPRQTCRSADRSRDDQQYLLSTQYESALEREANFRDELVALKADLELFRDQTILRWRSDLNPILQGLRLVSGSSDQRDCMRATQYALGTEMRRRASISCLAAGTQFLTVLYSLRPAGQESGLDLPQSENIQRLTRAALSAARDMDFSDDEVRVLENRILDFVQILDRGRAMAVQSTPIPGSNSEARLARVLSELQDTQLKEDLIYGVDGRGWRPLQQRVGRLLTAQERVVTDFIGGLNNHCPGGMAEAFVCISGRLEPFLQSLESGFQAAENELTDQIAGLTERLDLSLR